MTGTKFISQQERMANLAPELKRGLEEFKKENYHKTEHQYYAASDKRLLIYWEEYQAARKEENKEIDELIIEPNKFEFKDNKLVIKQEDYPQLRLLYACGLGLEEVELDCKSLENLYLIHNSLTEIDLSRVPNLRHLAINNNELEEIDLNNLNRLEEVHCQNNQLCSLSVKNFNNLWRLDCSNNTIDNLLLENLDNLVILDADQNLIENLDFPYLPKLEMLSLRNNNSTLLATSGLTPEEIENLKEVLFLRSPKLIHLDYYYSNIKEVRHALGLENPDKLMICNDESYRNPDGSYNPDVPTDWEDFAYRMHQQRELEWIRGDWGFAFEDNPNKFKTEQTPVPDNKLTPQLPANASPAEKPVIVEAKYKLSANKDRIRNLDLSHRGLTGRLTIENCANLTGLNVGNNKLTSLVVKNCPKLQLLIYSHNHFPKGTRAEISGCDSLTEIDCYKRDAGEEIGMSAEEQERWQKHIAREEAKEAMAAKAYTLLQNKDQYSLEELTQQLAQINLELLDDAELAEQIKALALEVQEKLERKKYGGKTKKEWEEEQKGKEKGGQAGSWEVPTGLYYWAIGYLILAIVISTGLLAKHLVERKRRS